MRSFRYSYYGKYYGEAYKPKRKRYLNYSHLFRQGSSLSFSLTPSNYLHNPATTAKPCTTSVRYTLSFLRVYKIRRVSIPTTEIS